MKLFIVAVVFYTSVLPSWCQGKMSLNGDNSQPAKIFIQEVEKKYNVKYSYVETLLIDKNISLLKGDYTIDEINSEIEKQTLLKVIKIDNRFYSICLPKIDNETIISLQEVFVEEFLSPGISKQNQKITITPKKINTLPGVSDVDVLLSIQQLPGVKSPYETATGLYIRGGSSDQNQIMWDGIRIYHPGHLFGMISGMNPNINQKVYYYNKGTNPLFGERISSVIDIKTTDSIQKVMKFNFGLNSLSIDGYCQIPLLKNKFGLQLAVRKSFTEWFQTTTFNQLAQKVFQNTSFKKFDNQNQFGFYDCSAKFNLKLSDKTKISTTFLVVNNNLDYKYTIKKDTLNNQKMRILNYGFSFNWIQKYNSKLTHFFLIHYSGYDFKYLKKQYFDFDKYEAYKKLNRVFDSGVDLGFNYLLDKNNSIDFGYSLSGNDVSHLFNTYNQDIGIDVNFKQNYNISNSFYSKLKKIYKKWMFDAGIRYSRFGSLGSESFEPRVLVQNTITPNLTFQCSYEKKSQILTQVRENSSNDLSLENYIWTLANPKDFPVLTANHFTTGFIFKKKGWLFDMDAYYKTINNITSYTLGFFTQSNNKIHNGEGSVKGLEILIQKQSKNWNFWLTYSYQYSQNFFQDLNNGKKFPMNFDIKHSFNMSLIKRWNSFSLALGWFWHSGKPYSKIDNEGQIVSFNSNRLSDYHRLDISGFYEFKLSSNTASKVGFSLYNVYNRQVVISKEIENGLGNFFTPSNTKTINNYYSQKITPSFFLRIYF